MPRKGPAKRRRDSTKNDGDENPKDGKQSKVQTTPSQAPASENSDPPPMQLHTNPKVPSSAVNGIPPPPIEESAEGNGEDDMVPPAMNIKSVSKDGKLKGSKEISGEKMEKSTGAVEDEAPEEIELEETPSGGGACFNFLLVLFLIGLGCSAGFVHQRIVQDLQTQLKGYQQDLKHSESQMATLVQERDAVSEQTENIRGELLDLVHEIRYFSHQQLKAKFGPGPMYQVELELEIPGTEGETNLQYMTIDLDGENMPHAVLTFMSQVDAGLYQTRGFGFHHSGDHVVFGSPIGVENGIESGEVWEASGFSRLVFYEYSEVVPHVPYTIGFSGRGPSLYFNMLDNTEAHRKIRDPCFGTISRGRNVVDYIHSMAGKLNPGDWKEMEKVIVIRSAVILRPQE